MYRPLGGAWPQLSTTQLLVCMGACISHRVPALCMCSIDCPSHRLHACRPPCRRDWYESYCMRDDDLTPCSEADMTPPASNGCNEWAQNPCTTCTGCFSVGCPFVDEALAPSLPRPLPLSPPQPSLPAPSSPPPLHRVLIQECCAAQPSVVDQWRSAADTPYDPSSGLYGPPCRRDWYERFCIRDDGSTPCSEVDMTLPASNGCNEWARIPCTICTVCFGAGCPYVDVLPHNFEPTLSPPMVYALFAAAFRTHMSTYLSTVALAGGACSFTFAATQPRSPGMVPLGCTRHLRRRAARFSSLCSIARRGLRR